MLTFFLCGSAGMRTYYASSLVLLLVCVFVVCSKLLVCCSQSMNWFEMQMKYDFKNKKKVFDGICVIKMDLSFYCIDQNAAPVLCSYGRLP